MPPQQVLWGDDGVPEHILDALVRALSLPSPFPVSWHWAVLVSPEHHAFLERAGWSKADVRRYLFERVRVPVAELKRSFLIDGPIVAGDERTAAPRFQSPDQILVLLAGGEAGQFSAIIPNVAKPPKAQDRVSVPVTKRIRGI